MPDSSHRRRPFAARSFSSVSKPGLGRTFVRDEVTQQNRSRVAKPDTKTLPPPPAPKPAQSITSIEVSPSRNSSTSPTSPSSLSHLPDNRNNGRCVAANSRPQGDNPRRPPSHKEPPCQREVPKKHPSSPPLYVKGSGGSTQRGRPRNTDQSNIKRDRTAHSTQSIDRRGAHRESAKALRARERSPSSDYSRITRGANACKRVGVSHGRNVLKSERKFYDEPLPSSRRSPSSSTSSDDSEEMCSGCSDSDCDAWDSPSPMSPGHRRRPKRRRSRNGSLSANSLSERRPTTRRKYQEMTSKRLPRSSQVTRLLSPPPMSSKRKRASITGDRNYADGHTPSPGSGTKKLIESKIPRKKVRVDFEEIRNAVGSTKNIPTLSTQPRPRHRSSGLVWDASRGWMIGGVEVLSVADLSKSGDMDYLSVMESWTEGGTRNTLERAELQPKTEIEGLRMAEPADHWLVQPTGSSPRPHTVLPTSAPVGKADIEEVHGNPTVEEYEEGTHHTVPVSKDSTFAVSARTATETSFETRFTSDPTMPVFSANVEPSLPAEIGLAVIADFASPKVETNKDRRALRMAMPAEPETISVRAALSEFERSDVQTSSPLRPLIHQPHSFVHTERIWRACDSGSSADVATDGQSAQKFPSALGLLSYYGDSDSSDGSNTRPASRASPQLSVAGDYVASTRFEEAAISTDPRNPLRAVDSFNSNCPKCDNAIGPTCAVKTDLIDPSFTDASGIPDSQMEPETRQDLEPSMAKRVSLNKSEDIRSGDVPLGNDPPSLYVPIDTVTEKVVGSPPGSRSPRSFDANESEDVCPPLTESSLIAEDDCDGFEVSSGGTARGARHDSCGIETSSEPFPLAVVVPASVFSVAATEPNPSWEERHDIIERASAALSNKCEQPSTPENSSMIVNHTPSNEGVTFKNVSAHANGYEPCGHLESSISAITISPDRRLTATEGDLEFKTTAVCKPEIPENSVGAVRTLVANNVLFIDDAKVDASGDVVVSTTTASDEDDSVTCKVSKPARLGAVPGQLEGDVAEMPLLHMAPSAEDTCDLNRQPDLDDSGPLSSEPKDRGYLAPADNELTCPESSTSSPSKMASEVESPQLPNEADIVRGCAGLSVDADVGRSTVLSVAVDRTSPPFTLLPPAKREDSDLSNLELVESCLPEYAGPRLPVNICAARVLEETRALANASGRSRSASGESGKSEDEEELMRLEDAMELIDEFF